MLQRRQQCRTLGWLCNKKNKKFLWVITSVRDLYFLKLACCLPLQKVCSSHCISLSALCKTLGVQFNWALKTLPCALLKDIWNTSISSRAAAPAFCMSSAVNHPLAQLVRAALLWAVEPVAALFLPECLSSTSLMTHCPFWVESSEHLCISFLIQQAACMITSSLLSWMFVSLLCCTWPWCKPQHDGRFYFPRVLQFIICTFLFLNLILACLQRQGIYVFCRSMCVYWWAEWKG